MLWRVYTCWIPARRSSQIWSSPICFRPWGVWVRLDVILSALTLLLTFDWFSCLSLKSYSSIGSSGERGQGGAVLREQQQTGKKPVRNKRYTIRVDTFEQTSFLRVVCVNKWQKTNRNLLSDADSADIFHKDSSTSPGINIPGMESTVHYILGFPLVSMATTQGTENIPLGAPSHSRCCNQAN